jgi:hypothetical protein
MPQQQPMPDVIVLIPGILGSVLVKDGREVWGASGSSVVGNLITFGGALKGLELPRGIGHGDPKDGVTAPRVLPSLYMIPTFWKADGYGRLGDRLEERFTVTAATDGQIGNLVEFPYDWRLSNQFNAQRLSERVIPVLERWRQSTGNPDAKLVFICHSMGGLVARYFLEVLGGRELTSKLLTIGTPYRGLSIEMPTGPNPRNFPLTRVFHRSTNFCRPMTASMSATAGCATLWTATCQT